jgi:hypothetical protein
MGFTSTNPPTRRQPEAIFYPLEDPTPYAYGFDKYFKSIVKSSTTSGRKTSDNPQ